MKLSTPLPLSIFLPSLTHWEMLSTLHGALSSACFTCLLGHVCPPCMVLHKAVWFYMFFYSAKKLSNDIYIFKKKNIYIFCFAVRFSRFEMNLPAVKHGTTYWYRFRFWEECAFFSIWIIFAVKKWNAVAKGPGSPGLQCHAQKGRRTVLN